MGSEPRCWAGEGAGTPHTPPSASAVPGGHCRGGGEVSGETQITNVQA